MFQLEMMPTPATTFFFNFAIWFLIAVLIYFYAACKNKNVEFFRLLSDKNNNKLLQYNFHGHDFQFERLSCHAIAYILCKFDKTHLKSEFLKKPVCKFELENSNHLFRLKVTHFKTQGYKNKLPVELSGTLLVNLFKDIVTKSKAASIFIVCFYAHDASSLRGRFFLERGKSFYEDRGMRYYHVPVPKIWRNLPTTKVWYQNKLLNGKEISQQTHLLTRNKFYQILRHFYNDHNQCDKDFEIFFPQKQSNGRRNLPIIIYP
jgi:hypothetical protein